MPRAPAPDADNQSPGRALHPLLHSLLAPSRALLAPLCGRTCVRHGRLAKLAAAAFSPPRAPSSPTVCANTFPIVRRPFGSPFSATEAAVAPSPPEQPPALRLLARPAGHRPPRAELGSPAGAHGPLVPPRHFSHHRRASSGRQTAGSCAAPSKITSRDLGFEFEFREGPFCEPVDSDE